MKRMINGNFSSISDAELMFKIANDSTGIVTPTEDSDRKEPGNSDAENEEAFT